MQITMKLHAVCFMLLMPVVTGLSTAGPLNTGKFWHVTDFHYDHTYWSSQLSCNAEVKERPAFGDYWCDSPWRLITSAIEAMAQRHKDVDFLLWTGDTVAHISDDHLSVDINMDILQNLTTALQQTFPDKTVYASYGNHDYYPSDQFPNMNNIIYNRTALMWQNWIQEPQQLDNFRKGGYYTRQVSVRLRVVVLNTNLYYTSDKQTVNVTDPSDQMAWLRVVLGDARTAGEKVMITAHIPPGVHTPSRVVWFQQRFNQAFIMILQDFTDVIVAMHFGHDHHDGFKVFYNKQGKAAVPLFVAPSVTPWRYKTKEGKVGPAHNPSVRLVTYDRDTGLQLNIEQLILNLTQANLQGTANFSRLYSFTEHYQVPDLSAGSLEALVTRMASASDGGKLLLQDYFWFATTGADQGSRTCDDECKRFLLCGFRHYDYDSFDACVEAAGSASGLLHSTAALVVVVTMTVAFFTE